jgi:hypothetical protein
LVVGFAVARHGRECRAAAGKGRDDESRRSRIFRPAPAAKVVSGGRTSASRRGLRLSHRHFR